MDGECWGSLVTMVRTESMEWGWGRNSLQWDEEGEGGEG